MKLTLQQLEAHLWGAANILRGKTAGQDYKNYILSLMFYKRLCDQWECEADDAIAEQEKIQGRPFTEKQKAIFRAKGMHRFKIPDGSRWGDVKAASTNIGQVLTKAMRAVANANDELRGVFTVDWNQPAPDGSGKPLIPNEVVHALIQHFDEHGHHASNARYIAQEMNWGIVAIGKINYVLHGLEAEIKAGASTITDPQFLEAGPVKKFSLVVANFPFSDEFWWLKPEQQTDDKKKKDKLKKEIFGNEGFKDPFGRFGRATGFKAPPAGYGDYAFILHILASMTDEGRAGIVCPQGVLSRGQPEVEDEMDELDEDGNATFRRRKADDEHLIRKALLESHVIDAVISL